MTTRQVVIQFDIDSEEPEELARKLEHLVDRIRAGDDSIPVAFLNHAVPAEELREGGVILEANRRFFHPIGLAISLVRFGDGTFAVSGITAADDVEGYVFVPASSEEEARGRKARYRKFYADNAPKLRARTEALPWGQPEQPISDLFGEWARLLFSEDLDNDDREFERKMRKIFAVGEKIVGRGQALVSITDRRRQIAVPAQGVISRLAAAGRVKIGPVGPDFPGDAMWLEPLPDVPNFLAQRDGNDDGPDA